MPKNPTNRGNPVCFAVADSRLEFVPLIELSHARRVDETRVLTDGSGSCPKPDKVHTDDASALALNLPSVVSRMGSFVANTKKRLS
jgi:hypothetical protein